MNPLVAASRALLIIGAVLVVGWVLLYADPDEGLLPQVFTIAGVTVLVVASLLAVQVLQATCTPAGAPLPR